MNTGQIYCALKTNPITRHQFCGVFASNQLPEELSLVPSCLVANTDPDSEPGEHWVAVYRNADGSTDYFDSYGRQPTGAIKSWLYRTCGGSIRCNHKCLQSPLSSACGQYCVYFLLSKCRGLRLPDIVKCFTKNTLLNDACVVAFVNRYFCLSTTLFDDVVINQVCKALQNAFDNKH
jgi:hypothetical protein